MKKLGASLDFIKNSNPFLVPLNEQRKNRKKIQSISNWLIDNKNRLQEVLDKEEFDVVIEFAEKNLLFDLSN